MSRRSYTLAVIDMQKDFHASKSIIYNVKQEIERAINTFSSIIFVEYNGCSKTYQELIDHVKGYPHFSIVEKYDDNGSDEIIRTIIAKDYPRRVIRVCGVNTDACVESTVFGLSLSRLPLKIEVVSKACNSDIDHNSGLRAMEKDSNVYIV